MTPKPPGLLVRYLKQSRCVVFVGAGLSVGAGLPVWRRLLEEVIAELVSSMPDGDTHREELTKLVEQGKLLEVADFCKEQLGAAYHQFLTERLRGDKGKVPETHKELMRLPFSAWVTTNYDKLLERAYSEVKEGYPKTLTHKDTDTLGRLLFDAGPFILKAHGDIDRPETVVLTSRDYSEIIHSNPAFNEIFAGLLLTKALFFVGYSLSDPDFRLLMDRQLTHFRGFVPERFALMTGLGPVERDVLWRTARIQVISYNNASGKHTEVLEFLQALSAAVQPAPVPLVQPPQPQSKVTSQNTSSSAPVQLPRTGSPPVGAGPSPTAAPAPASPLRPQSPAPGGGILDRLLNSLSLDDQLAEDERAEPASAPAFISQDVFVAPSPPVAQAQRAAAQQQTPPGLQRLFIEAVEGRLQLRLTDEASTPLAQGLAPKALNAEVFESLKQAGKDTRLHASLYSDLGRLFARYLPGDVLKVLGASGASREVPLELHPAAELARFPWELLPLGDKPMSLVRTVVRAPVGIPPQARGKAHVRDAPRILLVEGQRSRGASELESLAAMYRDTLEEPAKVTVLAYGEGTFDRVMRELDDALPDLLYYTGDVKQVDGELFLNLPGEVELSMGALRSVFNRGQLPFLVISAPSSAFAPHAFGVHPGEDTYQRLSMPKSQAAIFEGRAGFMELATQSGVGAFVGTFDMPSPQVSTAFMLALHQAFVLRFSAALAVRHALREVHQKFPGDPTVFSYVLSGDGGLHLLKPGG